MRLCASASCRREDGDRASESQRAQRCLRLPGAGFQLINRAAFWLVAKREPSSNLGSYRQLVLLLLCVPSVRLCDLLLLFSFHHPLRAPAAHVPRIIEYHIIYHILVVNNNPAGTTRSSRTCQSPHPHTLKLSWGVGVLRISPCAKNRQRETRNTAAAQTDDTALAQEPGPANNAHCTKHTPSPVAYA